MNQSQHVQIPRGAENDKECKRVCTQCREDKPYSAFPKRRGRPTSICKACKSVKDRAYRQANKEALDVTRRVARQRVAEIVSRHGREALLTVEKLKTRLHYDPETGRFTRLTDAGGAHVGDEPGWINDHGYRIISIDSVKYRAHRLAWLYMTGQWPKKDVDHRNTIPHDNRWVNLREATDEQNLQNIGTPKHNTSGLKGANWRPDKQKWRASICSRGRWRHLGYFNSKEEAHAAYCKAARELNGEFANFGEAA